MNGFKKNMKQIFLILSVLILVFHMASCSKMTGQEQSDYQKIGQVLKKSGIDSDYNREMQRRAQDATEEELDALLDDFERRLDILASELGKLKPQSEKGSRVHRHLFEGSSRGLAAFRKIRVEEGFNNPEKLKEFDREIAQATEDMNKGRNLFIRLFVKDVIETVKNQP